MDRYFIVLGLFDYRAKIDVVAMEVVEADENKNKFVEKQRGGKFMTFFRERFNLCG